MPYRQLTEREAKDVADLKALADAFITKCKDIGPSREMALAVTNAEQASMWAVKAVTK